MTVPDQRTIWRRRAILMACVGLVVAIPVTIAVRDGDDSGDDPVGQPALPQLGAIEFDRDLGIELRVPEGWNRTRKRDTVAYRSGDGGTLIAIVSPGPAEDAEAIQAEAVAEVEREYGKVEVIERLKRTQVGDRPAAAVVMSARQPEPGDDEVRVLVATAEGDKRAYLVEVFASDSTALVEAQALLNNLRLEG